LLGSDYKGKEADRLVTRINPGVVLPVAELRGHERQAAEELERRKTRGEEPAEHLDASSSAITLAMILTRDQLLEMKRKASELPLELELEQKTSA
jgi:hypothetical protein